MKKIENKNALIEIKDSIIRITYKKRVVIEMPDAEEISEFILANIVSGKNYGLINDIRLMKNMSSEARNFLAKRSTVKFNAIVLNSSAQSILAKMYLNFSKPLSKTKVFSDLTKAESWIFEELEMI
ncbi:MAG: hypothetical protein JXR68_06695 [Bacteroidales bacterium]|nr:hypothetical protein [Bacteroidales bacterium]